MKKWPPGDANKLSLRNVEGRVWPKKVQKFKGLARTREFLMNGVGCTSIHNRETCGAPIRHQRVCESMEVETV